MSVFLLCAFACAFAGCSLFPEPRADPTRYYVLGGETLGGDGADAKVKDAGLVLGLRTVQVPDYLGGKAMVVRGEHNEIRYRDFSRWAEPLEEAIARRLTHHLEQAPDIKRVLGYPFPIKVRRDIDLTVRVLRCEGAETKTGFVAMLAFEVQITDPKRGDLLYANTFSATDRPWNGKDFGQLSEQLGTEVNRLAEELSQSIVRLPRSAGASQAAD